MGDFRSTASQEIREMIPLSIFITINFMVFRAVEWEYWIQILLSLSIPFVINDMFGLML